VMSSTARAASASRKHVMESVLTEFPLPNYEGGQRIGRIEASRGGNRFLVSVPDPNRDSGLDELLCRLPSRFLNKIWVKRGDFVIVDFEDPTIMSVLYPKQIAHIRSEHLWPSVFALKEAEAEKSPSSSDDSSDESATNSSDDAIFQNPNRRRVDSDSDDSSDESSSEEDDD